MYTIKQYLTDTRLLASSLVIKHHHIGVTVNMGLLKKYGTIPPEDPREWKYYLNLSGAKHSTNADVLVKLVETGETVSLTPEVLKQYKSTRDELDARVSSYKELIENYPNDITYIHGCITPIDIDTALAAPNGAVLTYSSKYVEPQELSLISSLTKDIINFFSRWYIPEYNITDELYMSSVVSTIYNNLPNIIANKRLAKVYTSEANSFHIEHFFRSHLDIWEGVRQLNMSTVMWLYNNLVYLMNTTGSSDTFKMVIDKILTPNGIGIGTHNLTSGGRDFDSTVGYLEEMYKLKEPVFNVMPLNQYFNSDTNVNTIETIVKKEVSLFSDIYGGQEVILDTLTTKVKSDIGKLNSLTQNTKVLDFGKINLFKLYNNNLTETVLDNWLFLAATGKYTTVVKIIDTNTKDILTLSPYDGVMLFYYLLFKLFGNDEIVIDSITYTNVIKDSVSTTELLDKLLTAKGNYYIAEMISDSVPSSSGIISDSYSFSVYINKITELYAKLWLIDSNVNNTFLSGNIKRMVDKLYSRGKIYLTNDSSEVNLRDYLISKNVQISLNENYNIESMLTVLFKTFTGMELDETVLIDELYSNYVNMVEKLTSYTTQVIPQVTTDTSISVPYSTIEVNQTITGYIGGVDCNVIKVLEDNNSKITGSGNNFCDMSRTTEYNTTPDYILDYDNHIELVTGGYSFITSGEEVDSIGTLPTSTSVETMASSYIKYAPGIGGFGNENDDSIQTTTDTGSTTNALRLSRNDGIMYTDKGDVVYVENIGNEVDPYLPGTTSSGNTDDNSTTVVADSTDNTSSSDLNPEIVSYVEEVYGDDSKPMSDSTSIENVK